MFINSFYPTLFRSADFEGFKHWQPVLHFSFPQTQRACIFFILLLLPNSRTITDVVLSKIYNILPSNYRMCQHSWSKNNKESPRLYRPTEERFHFRCSEFMNYICSITCDGINFGNLNIM